MIYYFYNRRPFPGADLTMPPTTGKRNARPPRERERESGRAQRAATFFPSSMCFAVEIAIQRSHRPPPPRLRRDRATTRNSDRNGVGRPRANYREFYNVSRRVLTVDNKNVTISFYLLRTLLYIGNHWRKASLHDVREKFPFLNVALMSQKSAKVLRYKLSAV